MAAQADEMQQQNLQASERLSRLANNSAPVDKDFALDQLAGRIAELELSLTSNDQAILAAKEDKINRPQSQPELAPAPNGDRDDLKLIFGIGPALEKQLNRMGISTYRQIANCTAEDIRRFDDQLPGFSSRLERHHWIAGAKEQQSKKYGEAAREG